jgi:hypothetical protein
MGIMSPYFSFLDLPEHAVIGDSMRHKFHGP